MLSQNLKSSCIRVNRLFRSSRMASLNSSKIEMPQKMDSGKGSLFRHWLGLVLVRYLCLHVNNQGNIMDLGDNLNTQKGKISRFEKLSSYKMTFLSALSSRKLPSCITILIGNRLIFGMIRPLSNSNRKIYNYNFSFNHGLQSLFQNFSMSSVNRTFSYPEKGSQSNDTLLHFVEFSNVHNSDRSSNATRSNLVYKMYEK